MMKKNKGVSALIAIAAIVAVTFFLISTNGAPTDARTMLDEAEEAQGLIEKSGKSMEMVDAEAALAKRALGDENAPVVIEEYASLSCNHCASFHKDTFPKLKEEYIDTGKVYFIYNDFPLNASALDGAMVARCMPEKNYFKFISFLFETQEDWAFSGNYKDILEQNAKLLGLGSDHFQACLANNELRTGLLEIVREAQQDHQIQSTPSFVINGTRVLKGNQPFESFKKTIDPLVAADNETESGDKGGE